jgi:hypothetical protein
MNRSIRAAALDAAIVAALKAQPEGMTLTQITCDLADADLMGALWGWQFKREVRGRLQRLGMGGSCDITQARRGVWVIADGWRVVGEAA